MYLSFYNLKVKPFQMSTDPAFLWLGEKHREALAILKYAVLENKGVLALTGDVGTGKTTLINALLKSLGEDTVTATIYDARLEVLDFFNTVAAAFQIEGTFDGKGKFILQFMDFLLKTHERNQKILLIIDEAQGINEDLLEEIRLLSNLEAEYTRLLNIFFVGQNEFVDILQKYENRALRQRVTIRYHIDPLTLNETAAYIKYRLEVGGTEVPIFDSGAIDEVFFFSGGYPRLINIMCDHALLSGYVREIQVIKADLIRECREELLVSKKTSEKDFEYFRDDHRSLPSETMFTEPPVGRFIPVKDSHIQEDEQMVFSPSQPMSETMFTEPPVGPFIPVEDSHTQEDEQMVFSKPLTARELATPRKSSKKRFFRSPIAIAFILVVGLAAGYFFYGNDKNTAESFAKLAQQQAKKHFSAKAGSKNGKPPMVPATPETSDIPSRIEAGKVGDSRFFIAKSPNSSLLKETIPKETETPQVIPSKQFPEKNGVQTYTTKPGGPESDGNNKTMEANTAGVSNVSPDTSFETESSKELVSSTTKPVDTVPSNLRQKVPVIVPITEKTPETIKTKAVKPVEKPETGKSITKPVQAQKKTSERYQAKPKEKAQPVFPVPDEKKAVNRVDEKVVSLSVPVSKSETAGKASVVHHDLHTRLKVFLNEYCKIYEQKDLDKFSNFFASNAVEKGKPFRFWLSKYRQNFNRIDSIEYDIELERFATHEETGLVKIDGMFHVRAKLVGSKKWRKNSGQISMVLEADGNSFKVRQLDY